MGGGGRGSLHEGWVLPKRALGFCQEGKPCLTCTGEKERQGKGTDCRPRRKNGSLLTLQNLRIATKAFGGQMTGSDVAEREKQEREGKLKKVCFTSGH